jgi:hypothetical protein
MYWKGYNWERINVLGTGNRYGFSLLLSDGGAIFVLLKQRVWTDES